MPAIIPAMTTRPKKGEEPRPKVIWERAGANPEDEQAVRQVFEMSFKAAHEGEDRPEADVEHCSDSSGA